MDSKTKIFIIDDDSLLLDMYVLKFNNCNFDVTFSFGPEDALDKLRGGLVPEVMLVDVTMPVMDGFEFLQKVKDENLIPSTIRIILSNRGTKEDIERGKEFGVAGYIVKALNTPSEVVENVNTIINNSKNKNGL
jgi:CheY-like chemotaxis protein